MTDTALALIIQMLNELRVNALLAIDEHTDIQLLSELHDKTTTTVITQRFDQYQQLQALGFTALLNDYDLADIKTDNFECLAIRIGKQKDISHRLLNQCHSLLPPNGRVIIAGSKTEGIKSLSKNIQKLSTLLNKARGKSQHEAYVFERFETDNQLNDHNYSELRPSPIIDDLQFISKPGIYGWQKIDKGSKLLMDSIAEVEIPKAAKVLDLGCGYGFLSILASMRYDIRITATDNNIAAVRACNANLERFNCNGQAVASNCADTISERFDTVLCNPPFHTGFNVTGDLTERFIGAAKQRLTKKGIAYFVVNNFVPIEKRASPYFNDINLLAKVDGFSVFALRNI